MPLDISFDPSHRRASLVFSHPTGNIVTAEIVAQLRAAVEDLANERQIKLVTLEGAGPDFSFGASIPEHGPGEIARVLPEMHALIFDLVALPMPTAAVVRGRCLGGGFELALACDFIFADETAMFGVPEIALGVFPPAASVLLPVRAGAARATSAILTGEARAAADWHALGLIERVAPTGGLAAAVDEWFQRTLAPRSAEALRQAVRAARLALSETLARDLPRIERLYLDDLMRTHDAVEGVQAFLEKRPPRWRDR
jgi:cyclohexa-1,5-dienecarbonyl-CoA hydratase